MGFLGETFGNMGKIAVEEWKKFQAEQARKQQIGSMREDELVEVANGNGWEAIYAANRLANDYLLQMDYQNAEFWARKGVREHNPESLFLLGVIASQQGNFGKCEQWHLQNVNFNSDADSASELGFLWLNPSENPELPTDLEKAKYYFDFALKQNSKHAEASYGLVLWLLMSDSLDESDYSEMSRFKELLRNATHSAQATIRDDAENILQDVEKRYS